MACFCYFFCHVAVWPISAYILTDIGRYRPYKYVQATLTESWKNSGSVAMADIGHSETCEMADIGHSAVDLLQPVTAEHSRMADIGHIAKNNNGDES